VRHNQKRTRAGKVRFSTEKTNRPTRPSRNATPLMFAGLFLLSLVILTWRGRLPAIIGGVYLVASVVTYFAYAWDKSAARNNRWRTQESTLHGLALLGGWPGAALAQHVLRHKSVKAAFRTAFWFTVLVNCAALAWLIREVQPPSAR